MTFDLFGDADPGAPEPALDRDAPLAERMRPRTLAEVVGQEHLTGEGKLLGGLRAGAPVPSLVFWGPPGTGKTTLARLVARAGGARFVGLSAVTAGVKEIRETVAGAREARKAGRGTVLFLDEIHRFNKAQQDALLPHVESGVLTLLGATTENPSFEVNAALLSRCRVAVTRPLDAEALGALLERARTDAERGLGPEAPTVAPEARDLLVRFADGDARRLLGALELAADLAMRAGTDEISLTLAGEALQTRALRYDRQGEEHYDLISALHKSVRASDPDGAAYWLARMLAAGEEPLYLARRLARIAVEDVGLADPFALPLAMAAQQVVHFLGRPEGDAALYEIAIYLALAPKSNRMEAAEIRARELVEQHGTLPVPLAFRNAPTRLLRELGYGEEYRYDHDHPDGFAGQSGLPPELAGEEIYRPTDRGREKALGERKRELDARRGKTRDGKTSTD